MKYNIRGEKVEITEAIKSYIVEKIGKLEKYFDNFEDIEANVVIKIRGKEPKMEIISFERKDIVTLSGTEGDGGGFDPSTMSLQFD